MGVRILTQEQIDRAKELRQKGYTKRQLAILFEVGETTIWENVIDTRKRFRDRRIYFKRYIKKICKPCPKCSVCLTRELEKGLPPLNYQVGDKCIVCFLEEQGKKYLDIISPNGII